MQTISERDQDATGNVRFGSQPDIRTAKGYVRFTPDSAVKANFRKRPCLP